MDHHPLQRDLAIRVASTDVAQKKVAELKRREQEIFARVHELGEQVARAREAVANAAGAHACGETDAKTVEKARKALREAESETELAGLELQGVAARVAAAERELAACRSCCLCSAASSQPVTLKVQ